MKNYALKDVEESLLYPSITVDDVNQVIGMPKIVKVTKNNRIVNEVVFEETPIEKLNDGLCVDDFALEVLLENGYQLNRLDVHTESLEQVDRVSESAAALSKAKTKVSKTVKSE